jgi:hypothetical protein
MSQRDILIGRAQQKYAYLAALHILGSSRCPLAGGMAARLIWFVLYRSSITLIDGREMNDDCVDAWFKRTRYGCGAVHAILFSPHPACQDSKNDRQAGPESAI